MQVPRTLGALVRDVERDFRLVRIRARFGQIVDCRNQIRRFDDEQLLAYFHYVAFIRQNFHDTAAIGCKYGSHPILVETNFPCGFQIQVDELIAHGSDTNLFQLFRCCFDDVI